MTRKKNRLTVFWQANYVQHYPIMLEIVTKLTGGNNGTLKENIAQ